MSKKLDREFKEEFDNELREATYATRKIGTKILIGIVTNLYICTIYYLLNTTKCSLFSK